MLDLFFGFILGYITACALIYIMNLGRTILILKQKIIKELKQFVDDTALVKLKAPKKEVANNKSNLMKIIVKITFCKVRSYV